MIETKVQIIPPKSDLKITDVLTGMRKLTTEEIKFRRNDLIELYSNNKTFNKNVIKAIKKERNIIHGSHSIIDKENKKDYFVSEITIESSI